MVTLVNRAKMSTSTTGTGTITLGSAEDGYQSFADAGVTNGDVVRYVIEDGDDWEIGSGTYTASGTTLTRTVDESSNSDAALNLTGSAVVFITAAAEDLFQSDLTLDDKTANYTIVAGDAGKVITHSANSITVSLTAAATLGAGFHVWIKNRGAANSVTTIDPDGSETVDGRGIVYLYTGESTHLYTDGTKWYTVDRTIMFSGNTATDYYAPPKAAGAGSIAAGLQATADGSDAAAYGYTASASGTNSLSLGYATLATGTRSTAIGNSRAGGTDSFAAQIGSNSSSYGATGNNATAVGILTKATGLDFVFGKSSIASGGSGSLSLGMDNTSSAGGAVTLGKGNTASHIDAVVIGQGASSSAADEITLGHTDQTVRISSSYTLPTSDGTNGQVLTTDGSGAVTFADAGGGPDLYSDSANGSAVTPTSNAGGSYNSVAIGNGADIGSGRGESIAIGTDALTNQSQAIALGKAATVGSGGSFATALGRNSLANGTSATAIGTSYASGTDSLAAAIANNTSTYGATGVNSIAMGYLCKSTGPNGVSLGQNNIVSGANATAIGYFNTASGYYTTALGYDNTTSGAFGHAIGYQAVSSVKGKGAYASGAFSADGDAQSGLFTLRSDTTDATPEALTTDNSTPGTVDQIILPNNSVYGFTGTVIAREDSSSTDDFAVWEIKGGAVRGANAASTTLGSYNINKISESTGASNWSIALSADTTNGAVAIMVTGEAAHNIRWVATVNTTEVIY